MPIFALRSIVTNPTNDLITLTYASLAQSSLAVWHWYILDVCTHDQTSLEMLSIMERLDKRISIHKGNEETVAASMQTLLKIMARSGSLYGAVLVPYTTLEDRKSVV